MPPYQLVVTPKQRRCNEQAGRCGKSRPFSIEKNQSKCPLNFESWNGCTDYEGNITALIKTGSGCLDCGGVITVCGDNLNVEVKNGVEVVISPLQV